MPRATVAAANAAALAVRRRTAERRVIGLAFMTQLHRIWQRPSIEVPFQTTDRQQLLESWKPRAIQVIAGEELASDFRKISSFPEITAKELPQKRSDSFGFGRL